MSREEEIVQAANENYPSLDSEKSYEGFKDGAKWADKTMIEKVCKWLEENVSEYGDIYYDVGGYVSPEFHLEKFIEDFKKAMEE
jgi:hypothetical protein